MNHIPKLTSGRMVRRNRAQHMYQSHTLTGVMLFAATLLSPFGCGKSGNGEKRGSENKSQSGDVPKDVTLTPVITRAAERTIEITGTLYGEEDVTIAAEVAGRVVAVHADLGDTIDHGGDLAQIDTTDYVLAVDEARASLLAALARVGLIELPAGDIDLTTLPVVARAAAEARNAGARLERARKLYERTPPLISEQDFADIQTQHEVALTNVESERLNARSLLAEARVRQSALAQTQQRVTDARVIAPLEKTIQYRVASRLISVGEVVSEGQALFRIVASDRVKFRGSVPERFSNQIKVGAQVDLIVDGLNDTFDARVARIAPTVDIATRTFEVEVEAENPKGLLKPGGFVRARVTSRTDEMTKFAAQSAVVQFAGVQRVFSVRNGVLVEHRVRVGDIQNGRVELLGVPDGVDAVVDNPTQGTVPGTAVRMLN